MKKILNLIHKKGQRTDPMNYRPISLLNTSLKITDAIIFNKITPKIIITYFNNER